MANAIKVKRSRFDFVGKFKSVANESKGYREVSTDSGYQGHTITFGVEDNNGNRVFPELHGGKYESATTFKTFPDDPFSSEKQSMQEIKFTDRFEDYALDATASFSKIIVDLTDNKDEKEKFYEKQREIFSARNSDERELKDYLKIKRDVRHSAPNRFEFLHNIDAVEKIYQNLEFLEDRYVRVRGDIRFSEYKGNIQTKYEITSLEIMTQDEVKPNLGITVFPVFDKDSVDQSEIKKNGRLYIRGWIGDYYKQLGTNGFYPMNFALNVNNFDLSTDIGVSAFKGIVGAFSLKNDEKNGVFHLGWDGSLVSKPEEVDVNVDDMPELTDFQKSMIAAGMLNEKDIESKKSFGGFEKEFMLEKPHATGDYKNGKISTGLSKNEFENYIVRSSEDVIISDSVVKTEVPVEETPTVVEEVAEPKKSIDPSDILADLFD